MQDGLGFLWFGTQYGLNRYDGYRSKAFKHEPGRPDSLGCVYIRSLFVDHSGTLWIGCDQSLDKYNPINETFTHYHVVPESPGSLPAPVAQFSEDRAGMLWLATARGLYRFDPVSGQSTRYAHDPGDPTTIAGNDVKSTGEDRSGQFWVADNGGLEAFDRETGKVTRHFPFGSEIGEFHQDRSGVFWITSISPSCPLGSFDPKSERLTCHAINYRSHGHLLPVKIYTMLESQDGTMWLASMQAGILKIDRNLGQIISYGNHPEDSESLGSNDAISIYQDKEGDIWVCLQETDPNYFSEKLQAFENFTYQRGSLVSPLVTSIYEDREGILWIGSMGGLNRIDRRSGKNTTPPGSGPGNEMMGIIQDRSGALLAGTFQGLQRLDEKTGRLSPYLSHDSRTPPKTTSILRMLFDPNGTLWAATYGGVGRLDPSTGNFSIYTPDKQNTIDYAEIKEDGKENLWLGTAQSGLHRFDPRTAEFTIYAHNPDDPRSLSDDRVNSIYFDHSGVMWVGTQNGLDRFDSNTRSFKTYYEQDGLAGNVVSCILEDSIGSLWMGTNSGLSSFNPARTNVPELQRRRRASGIGPHRLGYMLQEPRWRDVLRRIQRRHGVLSEQDGGHFLYPGNRIDRLPDIGKTRSHWASFPAPQIDYLYQAGSRSPIRRTYSRLSFQHSAISTQRRIATATGWTGWITSGMKWAATSGSQATPHFLPVPTYFTCRAQ